MSTKRKILIAVLIIIGLLLVFINPLYARILNLKSNSTINKVASEVSAKQIKENIAKKESKEEEQEMYDYSKVKPLTPDIKELPTADFDAKNVIGILLIPERNIKMPIFKGLLNRNLYVGAGTVRADQVMGEKNYPLAGHHSTWMEGLLFNKLPGSKIGDFAYITDKTTVFKYKVYSNQRVPDTSVHLIENKLSEDRGKPVLSMFTCYSDGETNERTFVFAELVEKFPYDAKKFDALPGK